MTKYRAIEKSSTINKVDGKIYPSTLFIVEPLKISSLPQKSLVHHLGMLRDKQNKPHNPHR